MDMMDSDSEHETDKINVVPLADLTLVLLIIIMLLAPAAMSSMIRVETPNVDKKKSATKQHAKHPDPLLIKISSKGLTLNNNPVDSIQFLGEQLAIKLRDDPARVVIVSADDSVLVGTVVEVLDVAKQNGADKISLLKGSEG